MIAATNLRKTYKTEAAPLEVLKGVSLTVNDGEFIAITGASGAGKSTLLHLLAGLDLPTSGDVLWEGKSLTRMTDAERATLRNRSLGVVFQFYHLMPEFSALENVMIPGLLGRYASRKELRARALSRLDQVGLRDRASHKPSQLSGGELQRVAIARALINQPKIIFCDEPTGNLDSQNGQAVIELLRGLHQRERLTLVLVTHEHELATQAQRWLVLKDGELVSDTKQHIAHSTQHTERRSAG